MTTAVDTDVLDKLDWEHVVPCTFRDKDDTACNHPAAWRLVIRAGLPRLAVTDRPHIGLYCDEHKQGFLDHLEMCHSCRTLFEVTSIEPIR